MGTPAAEYPPGSLVVPYDRRRAAGAVYVVGANVFGVVVLGVAAVMASGAVEGVDAVPWLAVLLGAAAIPALAWAGRLLVRLLRRLRSSEPLLRIEDGLLLWHTPTGRVVGPVRTAELTVISRSTFGAALVVSVEEADGVRRKAACKAWFVEGGDDELGRLGRAIRRAAIANGGEGTGTYA